MSHSRRRLPALIVALGALAAAAAPAGAANVTIVRDTFGAPHVFGSDLDSTWFGVGYATAQDRLWQADILRRLGTGNSAEFFGPGDIPGDVTARALFGPKSRRLAMFDRLRPETQRILRAYTAGMNAWIDEAKKTGRLPIEYSALGVPLRRWAVDDSLATLIALAAQLGEGGSNELENLSDLEILAARLGPVAGGLAFADTHWLNDPTAPTSVPAGATFIPPPANSSANIDFTEPPVTVPDAAVAQYRRAIRAWKRNLERRAGIRDLPASNAIAIGPGLSADGKALLLGGPQLGYTTPQLAHQMGIHGGGFNNTGMAIAGIPLVVIGSAARHAWTLTTGGTDNQDIYVEALNPANPGQYQLGSSFVDFDCRLEVIPVRGSDPFNQILCQSIHGPVLATVPGAAITLRRAPFGVELDSLEALLDAMRARGLQRFADALSRAVHNFNVLYADTRGNIAYFHIGRVPIRAAGDNPWLPHPGIGIAEWQGFIPWSQMPRAANPAQGWLTSWNNKPRADWINSTRGFWNWGPVHRVNTLNNVLATLPPGSATTATLEQLNVIGALTTDTPSGSNRTVFVSSLLGDMLGAVDAAADPRLPPILGLLAGWDLLQLDLDNSGRYDNPQVAIFNTWWARLVDRVFADDLAGAMDPNVVGNLVARMLRPGQGLPLRHDYLGGETPGEAVTGALIAALDVLENRFGSPDPAAWQQRAAQTVWTRIGAVQVPNTPGVNRGTYNQITHLGDGADFFAVNVTAPGQSGDPFNRHFADQLALYATFGYKPMYTMRQALVGNTESVTVLNYTAPARAARKPAPGGEGAAGPQAGEEPAGTGERPVMEIRETPRPIIRLEEGKKAAAAPEEGRRILARPDVGR